MSGSVLMWRGSSDVTGVRGVLLGVTGVPSQPGVPAEDKRPLLSNSNENGFF